MDRVRAGDWDTLTLALSLRERGDGSSVGGELGHPHPNPLTEGEGMDRVLPGGFSPSP